MLVTVPALTYKWLVLISISFNHCEHKMVPMATTTGTTTQFGTKAGRAKQMIVSTQLPTQQALQNRSMSRTNTNM